MQESRELWLMQKEDHWLTNQRRNQIINKKKLHTSDVIFLISGILEKYIPRDFCNLSGWSNHSATFYEDL